MADDWAIPQLGQAPIEIIDGDRGKNYPKKPDFTSRGHCLFLNAGNVTTSGFDFSECSFISQEKDDALRKGKLRRYDIVLTTRGTVGNVAFYDNTVPFDHIRINSGMVVFRANPQKVHPRYLYFFLRSLLFKEQVVSLTTGSAQPQFPIKDIQKVKIPLPPIQTQHDIARVLGAFDDKIELNWRMNRTLEAMAAAIFKSWFIDFDPVVAKAAGRAPYGMNADIAALFPAAFQDSALGPIPDGWRVGKLGGVAQNIRRGAKPGDISPDTPYIGLEHMPRRNIALNEWGYAGEVISGKFLFHKGEILFGKLRPYFHKVGIAPVDGVCSTDILVVAPQQSEWFGFILGYLSSVDFINYVDAASGGTRMPRTNWDSMARFEVAIPDSKIARIYSKVLGVIAERINCGIFQSRTLAAIRDALLPKLLSGEIRVKQAEKIVENVV